jgi:hypothetical protein
MDTITNANNSKKHACETDVLLFTQPHFFRRVLMSSVDLDFHSHYIRKHTKTSFDDGDVVAFCIEMWYRTIMSHHNAILCVCTRTTLSREH